MLSRYSVSCALGSAAVSMSLWAVDALAVSRLAFAGASDPEAQARVLDAASRAVLSLEIRLALTHLVLGLSVGTAAASALALVRWGRALGPWASAGIGAGVASSLHGLALFGMVGTYPQLYADRWWLGGGAMAAVQRVVTHSFGPTPFDMLLVMVVSGLGAATLVQVGRFLRFHGAGVHERYGSRWAGAAVVLVAIVGFLRLPPTPPFRERPNVLIIASDSLRTDRVVSSDVMPFTASLVSNGSLFRHAFTPIARTYPSWVSTLTGTEPRRHGVRTMFPSVDDRRNIGPTLFTELRDHGYHTFVAADFSGDIFQGFRAGFETVDTPHLTVDTLAASSLLAAHHWSLPLLRLAWFRERFPVWRNLPNLADPDWVVDDALEHIGEAEARPFAGLLFFSTAHFPFAAPYPHYKRGSDDYQGAYLYHAPPTEADPAMSDRDIEQIRARYDAALFAVDRATERLYRELGRRGLLDTTVLVITSDHGEELYEIRGIAGHGDRIDPLHSQAVPILFLGPGVPRGRISDAQVRLYDLPATVLDLVDPDLVGSFGDGVSLFDPIGERPVCVETGLWFWPSLPLGLRGERLQYPGISRLVDLEPQTREMVLRADMKVLVETAKERGLILGNWLWRERFTPEGVQTELVEIPGIDPLEGEVVDGDDLRARFDSRCVDGDDQLARLFEAVVFLADGEGRK